MSIGITQSALDFKALLMTQLLGRIAYDCYGMQERYLSLFKSPFVLRESSYYVDSDRFMDTSRVHTPYPLINLLTVELVLTKKKSFLERLFHFKSVGKAHSTADQYFLADFFSPSFKTRLLQDPATGLRQLQDDDISAFVSPALTACLESALSFQQVLDTSFFCSFQRLIDTLNEFVSCLSTTQYLTVSNGKRLLTLFDAFLTALEYSFKHMSDRHWDGDMDVKCAVLKQYQLFFERFYLLSQHVLSVFFTVYLYELNVFLIILNPLNELKEMSIYRYCEKQCQDVLAFLSNEHGFLNSILQVYHHTSHVFIHAQSLVNAHYNSGESREFMSQLYDLQTRCQQERSQLKTLYFGQIFDYVDYMFTLEDAYFQRQSELFIVYSMQCSFWNQCLPELLSRLSIAYAQLETAIVSLPEPVQGLTAMDICVSSESQLALVSAAQLLESRLKIVLCLLNAALSCDRGGIYALVVQHFSSCYSESRDVSLFSFILQFCCVFLTVDCVFLFFHEDVQRDHHCLLRESMAHLLLGYQSDAVDSVFVSGKTWWNSVAFTEQWYAISGDVLLTLPQSCIRPLLSVWTREEILNSTFLLYLVSQYSSQKHVKDIFDCLILVIQDESLFSSFQQDFFLTYLCCKCEVLSVEHSALGPYKKRLSYDLQRLSERCSFISYVNDYDGDKATVSLIYESILLLDLCLWLMMTEVDDVVFYVIDRVGLASFVTVLCIIYPVDRVLFYQLFSFFSLYMIRRPEQLNDCFQLFSEALIKVHWRVDFGDALRFLGENGHHVLQYIAVKLHYFIEHGVMDDQSIGLPSTVLPQEVIHVFSNVILKVLECADDVLLMSSTDNKRSLQQCTQDILQQWETVSVTFLDRSFALGLTSIYTHCRDHHTFCNERVTRFISEIEASDLILFQKILLYQWLFLLSFSYSSTFSFWNLCSIYVYVPYLSESQMVIKLGNMHCFSEYFIPVFMQSSDSLIVSRFVDNMAKQLILLLDECDCMELVFSFLSNLALILDCLVSVPNYFYDDLKGSVSQLMGVLLDQRSSEFLLHPKSSEFFNQSLPIFLTRGFIDHQQLNLSHCLSYFRNNHSVTGVDDALFLSRQSFFELFFKRVDDYHMHSNPVSPICFYQDLRYIQSDIDCLIIINERSDDTVFKFIDILLDQLHYSTHQPLSDCVVFLLNYIFGVKLSSTQWKYAKLLKAFVFYAAVDNQFSLFLNLFYLEASVDERHQFLTLLFGSSFLFELYVLTLFEQFSIYSDGDQQTMAVIVVDDICSVIFSIQQRQRKPSLHVLLTHLVCFKCSVEKSHVNDLFHVNDLVSKLVLDMSDLKPVFVLCFKLYSLLSYFIDYKNDTLVDSAVMDFHTQFYMVLELIFQLQFILQSHSFSKSIQSMLTESLKKLVEALIHLYINGQDIICLKPTQLTHFISIIYSCFSLSTLIQHIIKVQSLNKRTLFRVFLLFSCDDTYQKNVFLRTIFKQYCFFDALALVDIIEFLCYLYQQGYDRQVILDIMFASSRGVDLFVDIMSQDASLGVVLFDDDVVFEFISRSEFLDALKTKPFQKRLFELFYPDLFSYPSTSSFILELSSVGLDHIFKQSYCLSQVNVSALSMFIGTHFFVDSTFVVSLLTILYATKPDIFWMVLCDPQHNIMTLVIHYFLYSSSDQQASLSYYYLLEWNQHDVFCESFKESVLSIATQSVQLVSPDVLFLFSLHDTRFVVDFDSSLVLEFICFCMEYDRISVALDSLDRCFNCFVSVIYFILFDHNNHTKPVSEEQKRSCLLFLTYLEPYRFYHVMTTIKQIYSLELNQILECLCQQMQVHQLMYRFEFMGQHMMPFLNQMTLNLSQSQTVVIDDKLVLYCRLCFFEMVSVRRFIYELGQFKYLPLLLPKSTLITLTNAFFDSDYMDLLYMFSVEDLRTFQLYLLTESFGECFYSLFVSQTVPVQSSLLPMIHDAVSQLSFFDSFLFLYNIFSVSLSSEKQTELREYFAFFIRSLLSSHVSHTISVTDFVVTLHAFVPVNLDHYDFNQFLMTSVIDTIFSDRCLIVFKQQVSFYLLLLECYGFDNVDQRHFLFKHFEVLLQSDSNRLELYAFLRSCDVIFGWTPFVFFIRGWHLKQSVFDIIRVYSRTSMDMIIWEDLLGGLSNRLMTVSMSDQDDDVVGYLLEVSVFLLQFSNHRQKVLRWIHDSLFAHLTPSHVRLLSQFLYVTTVDKSIILSILKEAMRSYGSTHCLSLLHHCIHDDSFLDLWDLFLSLYCTDELLQSADFYSHCIYDFVQHYLKMTVEKNTALVIRFCLVCDRYKIDLNYAFRTLCRYCVECDHFLPFRQFVCQVFKSDYPLLLDDLVWAMSELLLSQSVSMSWLFDLYFDYYRISPDDFVESGLDLDKITSFLDELCAKKVLNLDGFIQKELFYRFTKDQFQTYFSGVWTYDHDVFYVFLDKVISQKVVNRQYVLNAFYRYCPVILIGEESDSVSEGISSKHSQFVCFVDIVFQSYVDVPHYKIVLNELLQIQSVSLSFLTVIFRQFSSLSLSLQRTILLEPSLSSRSRFVLSQSLVDQDCHQWMDRLHRAYSTTHPSHTLTEDITESMMIYVEVLVALYYLFSDPFIFVITQSSWVLEWFSFVDFIALFRCDQLTQMYINTHLGGHCESLDSILKLIDFISSHGFSFYMILVSLSHSCLIDQPVFHQYLSSQFQPVKGIVRDTRVTYSWSVWVSFLLKQSDGSFPQISSHQIMFSKSLKQWLTQENLLVSEDTLEVQSFQQLADSYDLKSVFLTFVRKENVYDLALFDNDLFLESEAVAYFQHVCRVFNVGSSLHSFNVFWVRLLIRHFDFLWTDLACGRVEYDVVRFFDAFELGDDTTLMLLAYNDVFRVLFQDIVTVFLDKESFDVLNQWISSYAIRVQISDFESVSSQEVKRFFAYLQQQYYVDFRGQLLDTIDHGFFVHVPNQALKVSKKLSQSLYYIVQSKRQKLYECARIQFLFSGLLDREHSFNHQSFIQLFTDCSDIQWTFICQVLDQPIYHYQSVFCFILDRLASMGIKETLSYSKASFDSIARQLASMYVVKNRSLRLVFNDYKQLKLPAAVDLRRLLTVISDQF